MNRIMEFQPIFWTRKDADGEVINRPNFGRFLFHVQNLISPLAPAPRSSERPESFGQGGFLLGDAGGKVSIVPRREPLICFSNSSSGIRAMACQRLACDLAIPNSSSLGDNVSACDIMVLSVSPGLRPCSPNNSPTLRSARILTSAHRILPIFEVKPLIFYSGAWIECGFNYRIA